MKSFLPIAILAASMLSAVAASAQYYGGTSAPRPGVTVNVNPYGTEVGVGGPYVSFTYTTNGYYDSYGHFYRVSHKHKKHQQYCKHCEKEYRKMHKDHHHHDNGNHNGWHKH